MKRRKRKKPETTYFELESTVPYKEGLRWMAELGFEPSSISPTANGDVMVWFVRKKRQCTSPNK